MYISVIVPMYNSIDTIQCAIESVLKQTYKDKIEIVIVNDGSKDGCEKIVEEVMSNNKSNRTIQLINKLNSGVSSARNRGIKEASGEYIAFLDADDTWHPQKLEIIAEILENNEINFIGHAYTLDNNFTIPYKPSNPMKISFLKLMIKNFAVTPSIVVKRKSCLLFDETMHYAEDHELWLRMSLIQDVYYTDLPLTKLNRPPLSAGGLSSNKWAMRKGEMKMYKNITRHKKYLILFFPFLVIFSLAKHFRNSIKDLFAKN